MTCRQGAVGGGHVDVEVRVAKISQCGLIVRPTVSLPRRLCPTMKLKALIVDDMPQSRARVRRHLAGEPDIEIVGECGDGETALKDIRVLKPDVVMLDVQMPGLTGLDVIARLPADNRPAVVFVTAFEEFAVQAFAARAVDYLLKPIDGERFRQAMAKVRTFLENRRTATAAHPGGPVQDGTWLDRIAVKSVGRTEFVATAAIDWIATAGNYLALHCGKNTHLVRETMSRIEARLDPKTFVRIHRSTMVRIEAVQAVEPLFNGDRAVTLHDGTKLTLSRSFRDKAKAAFGDI
jgi:two-component system, LytTR family, response regulator